MLQEISLVEMQIYPQENVKMSLREGVQRMMFRNGSDFPIVV